MAATILPRFRDRAQGTGDDRERDLDRHRHRANGIERCAPHPTSIG
jgi:hypothetical protein